MVDDRTFTLEDEADTIAEEVGIKNFRWTITAAFDLKYQILADIESHTISVENEKDNDEQP